MDAEPRANDVDELDRPSIGLLFAQLTDDARDFARAETEWVKAQAGERWRYAMPAFAMASIGIAVLIGGFIALPVGLMFILGDYIGFALSVPIVVALAALIGLGFLNFAARRIKSAFKSPEDR